MRPPAELLGEGRWVTDPAELLTYESDAALDRAVPDAVLFPESADEVARVVAWARQAKVPLVARGAGTGLAGGAVAAQGGVVVAFPRMDRVVELDAAGRTAVVEAGVVNLDLDRAARRAGLCYPPDPASGRSCLVGGNLATNAGGPHCFKYGVTANYVLGLEVVLADGSAVRLGGRARDYPEYDLAGLVVGSEGTLALVTGACLGLRRAPPAVRTLLASFESLEAAGEAVSAVIAAGLVPAALEALDRAAMRVIEAHRPAGLPVEAGAALIVEVDGYPEGVEAQVGELAELLRRCGATAVRVAADEAERERIWRGRKSAGGAMARLAPSYYLTDITVRRSRLAAVLGEVRRIAARRGLETVSFFHAGDGNLHPLIPCDPRDAAQMARVHRAVEEIIELCVAEDGSLSGEHGVGIEKRAYMTRMHGPAELRAMREVKQAFDPDALLNPGKVLPAELGDAVRAEPRLPDGPVFSPASDEVAAAGLRALAESGRRVRIGSATAGPDRGAQPGTAGETAGPVWLSTAALRGVRSFAPEDLYVSVGAGTPLAEVRAVVGEQGLLAPLLSPWSGATVGGVVATNLNAPLRLRYGGVADQVLAARVAMTDGRLLRVGRPLVKNAAGYALPRIFVGSRGTLGLLTEVTLKLSPAPRARRTLAVPAADLAGALELARLALPVALVASAVVVAPAALVPGGPGGGWALLYTAEGLEPEVDAELALVRSALEGAGVAGLFQAEESGSETWATFLAAGGDRNLVVRAGVPSRDLEKLLDAAPAVAADQVLIDCAAGLVYAAGPALDPDEARAWLDAWRRPALAVGGYAVVLDGAPPLLDAVDRWGYRPPALAVMQRLEALWDPSRILQPGASPTDQH